MIGSKARIPALALASLLAACGGGGGTSTTNACTDPGAPRYTVNGAGLILPVAPGIGGATLSSFQLRLVEPVRLSTGGGVAGATLGGPVALGAAWAVPGVNPACSSVGVLSATYEDGSPPNDDFVVLSGAIETSAFPSGTTTAVATGPAFALPRLAVNTLATAAGITVTGGKPVEPFTVIWLPPAFNGAGGKTVGLVDSVGTPVTKYALAWLDGTFTGTQATSAAHGLAVMRKVDPTVLVPVQLEPRTGAGAGTALPRCSATVTTGCWDSNASQASVLPGAAFVAPIVIK
jgi:hypothetical protein